MGSDPAVEHAPDPDESPQHPVEVPAFAIGRTPVTNDGYREFVESSGRPALSHWPGGVIPPDRGRHPVTYVTWDDARAFCRWAGGELPTEAQWERAARGDDARTWPWGEAPPTDAHALHGAADTGPVGKRPAGASPFGALDLAGNVWEWTSSALLPYPYDAEDGREGARLGPRVVRGGSYIHGPGEIRCAFRHGMLPGVCDVYVGFRLAGPAGATVRGSDLVRVPAGVCRMGSDPCPSAGPVAPDEAPRHMLELPPLQLSLTPVTNAQYRTFVEATGHPPPVHWFDAAVPGGLDDHPVTYVDWHDAAAFCEWAGGRLPTEAEWERTARGDVPRAYPWGEQPPDESRLNYARGSKHGATTPVGAFPAGAGPYGHLDLAGNVWEWVSSAYRPYPYRADDGRERMGSPEQRVLRGGSYASPGLRHVRCASRSKSYPARRAAHIGFRLAR